MPRREQLARGRADALPGRTFSAPRKWMKGKGRITIQYGCYSYANPPVRAAARGRIAALQRLLTPRHTQGITEDKVEAMPKTLEGASSVPPQRGASMLLSAPRSCD